MLYKVKKQLLALGWTILFLSITLKTTQSIQHLRRSHLNQQSSDLATASYLIQGFPEILDGSSFRYRDDRQAMIEDRIRLLILSPLTTHDKKLKRAIVFLTSRCFVDKRREHTFLIIAAKECRAYLDILNQLGGSRTLSSEDKAIIFALKNYYAFVCNKNIKKSSSFFAPESDAGGFSKIVLKNVNSIFLNLKLRTKLLGRLSRPCLVR